MEGNAASDDAADVVAGVVTGVVVLGDAGVVVSARPGTFDVLVRMERPQPPQKLASSGFPVPQAGQRLVTPPLSHCDAVAASERHFIGVADKNV
jgi:hypothetical protein